MRVLHSVMLFKGKYLILCGTKQLFDIVSLISEKETDRIVEILKRKGFLEGFFPPPMTFPLCP